MPSMHGHDPYNKPRKVSFSDKLPAGLFAMTVATGGGHSSPGTDSAGPPGRRLPPDGPSTPTPSTPPPRRARFQRSPYVSHVRAPSTDSDMDLFMQTAPASTSTSASRASPDTTSVRSGDYDSPGPARYGGTLTPPRPRGSDPGWSVPRSPGPSPGADEYESASDSRASPSPSPSPRRTPLPRLDFSQVSTPITARKAFTPRAPPVDFTPSRPRLALGRKISLNNLGAYDASLTGSVGSLNSLSANSANSANSTASISRGSLDGFDEEVLGDIDSPTYDTSFESYRSHQTHATLDHAFEFERGCEHSTSFERTFDETSFVTAISEANSSTSSEAVDLAVDIAGLSIRDRAGDIETSLPTTPRRESIVDLSTPPKELFNDLDDAFTPRRNLSYGRPTIALHTPDMPSSPASDADDAFSDALSDVIPPPLGFSPAQSVGLGSPSPLSPPVSMPSVPATPGGGDDEYASDRSDWVPATASRRRRVVVSDSESDDDAAPAHRTQGAARGGLRGRTPAAIRILDEMSDRASDSSELERTPSKTRKEYAIDDSGDEYTDDESVGSLKDFIVDSDDDDDPSDYEDADDYEDAEDADDAEAAEDDLDALDGSASDHSSEGGATALDEDVIEILETSPGTSPGKHATGDRAVIEVLDSDTEDEDFDEDHDDDALLHFTPPPRPSVLPDTDTLNVGSPDSPPKVPRTFKPKSNKRIEQTMSKREWEAYRVRFAQDFFDELDVAVFNSQLGANGAKAVLDWSGRLISSAGNASRKTSRQGTSTAISYSINLSTKVLSTTDQIQCTLAHEMCHLACWVISKEMRNPHGKVFKSWGNRVMRARPDVVVTTKHNYEIQYKYSWRCSNTSCAKVYNRHSKSIDISRQVCGACRSRLEPMFESRQATGFQAFLKDNMKAAKAALPGASHGDVMRALSARWSEEPDGDHGAYWAQQQAQAN